MLGNDLQASFTPLPSHPAKPGSRISPGDCFEAVPFPQQDPHAVPVTSSSFAPSPKVIPAHPGVLLGSHHDLELSRVLDGVWELLRGHSSVFPTPSHLCWLP